MGNCKNCFKFKSKSNTEVRPAKSSDNTYKTYRSTDVFYTEPNEGEKNFLISKSCDIIRTANYDAPSAKIQTKPKTSEDLRLIKKAFSEHFLFSYLPETKVEKIAEKMMFFELKTQDIIFEQGNPGNLFFIMVKGIAEIVVNGVKKGYITEGHGFGELALIDNSERTATIRALDTVYLWGLERRVFKKILQSLNDLNLEENKNFLRKIPYLSFLTESQIEELSSTFVCQYFNNNQKIIVEGDPGNLFYIIQEGQVLCSFKGKAVRVLNKGEYFGELALIYNAARSATVISLNKTKVLSIGKESLSCILGVKYQLMLYRNSLRIAFGECEFLKSLKNEQVEEIINQLKIFSFDEGQVVIPQGTYKENFLWVVVKGSIHNKNKAFNVFQNLGAKWIYHQKHSIYKDNIIATEYSDIALIKTSELLEILTCSLAETFKLNEIISCLESTNLFKLLSTQKLASLAKTVESIEYPPNTEVFKCGDEGDSLYIIKEGQVEVRKDSAFIRIISKGSYFGERSIIFNENRTASIICKTYTKLLILKKEDFANIIDENIRNLLIDKINLQDDSVKLENLILVDFIGKGSFGKVYLCCNKQNNTLYALKVILRKKIEFHSLHKSLKQEKQIMQLTEHQFIIKLVKTFKDSQRIYFLLEYVQGLSLFEVLHIKNTLSSAECQFYFASLLVILEYLHKNSIIYRDLKPENVMVDKDGYLKLLDFGTSKVINNRTFSVIGTPQYMAPEVIMGKGYTFYADMWSLGIILFEFMCGSVPFGAVEEDDPFTIYRNIVSGTIVYPKFIKGRPREKKIIETLLDSIPDARGTAENLKLNNWFNYTYWDNLLSRAISPPYKPNFLIDSKNIQICIDQNRTVTSFLNSSQDTNIQDSKKQAKIQFKKDWDKDF